MTSWWPYYRKNGSTVTVFVLLRFSWNFVNRKQYVILGLVLNFRMLRSLLLSEMAYRNNIFFSKNCRRKPDCQKVKILYLILPLMDGNPYTNFNWNPTISITGIYENVRLSRINGRTDRPTKEYIRYTSQSLDLSKQVEDRVGSEMTRPGFRK